MDKKDRKEKLRVRLKDVLWSLRQQHSMANEIDRIIPFLAFDRNINREQLDALFIGFPKRISYDFLASLLMYIQQTVIKYWNYLYAQQKFHEVLLSIRFLEGVAKSGFVNYRLDQDDVVGYRLVQK